MSNLIEELKAAMAGRNQHVLECEAALVAAKADRDSFAAQIASELGIKAAGKGGRKPKEKASDEEPDVAKPERGSKSQRVLELYGQGKSSAEIAEAIGIPITAVYTHLWSLRKSGAIVESKGAPAPDEVDEDETETDPAEDAPEGQQTTETPQAEPSSERGASKDDLIAEVTRQQNGIRGKVVILGTTTAKNHRHTIRVDRMGDGQTVADGSGHVHRCYRFVLSQAQGHSHGVTTRQV